MDVSLSVRSEGDGGALAELHDWLRQEPELRGLVTAVAGRPEPGELGAVTDVLSIALGGGGALTVLATSLRTFFAQPRRSDITITITDPDGSSVEIDAHRVRDVEALARAAFDRPR
ncbi:hypothetical protein AB0M43_05915 [Longispora sp. NPDC051575]|uniref:effector-associated constant component EACC1 n=1 Tax=Longispora sp. NPDC051575 TaxID=3154943 RepID=UPI00343BABEF